MESTKKSVASTQLPTKKATITQEKSNKNIKETQPCNMVTITIHIANSYKPESVFICGNIAKLGEWDATKAVATKKIDDCTFAYTAKLTSDCLIEFKILNQSNWLGVDKGIWGEEIVNHSFVVAKGIKQDINVYNWRVE